MTQKKSSNRSAWVQLYEARQAGIEIESRSPGRPPSPIPRRKVGMTLSQGEANELHVIQEQLSEIMNRKVSVGETVGIITRICTARISRVFDNDGPETLSELVERMVG